MKKLIITLTVIFAVLTQNTVMAENFAVCTHMGLRAEYDNDLNIRSAQETGAEWIRDECRWGYMQSEANGKITIRQKDLDYIKKTHNAGINQLLILSFGNSNYGLEAEHAIFPTQEYPDYYKGYLDYVRYTVGQVKDYVEAYEVWNEPNIQYFNEYMADGTEYAKLYLDVKAIIDELDPTATLLCGSITGRSAEGALEYAEQIFDYVESKGDVNQLIKAFSIHLYAQLNENDFIDGLNDWEAFFDSYGYTGDVWMTENGVTADNESGRTESVQAEMLYKYKIQWDKYLKDNDRNGKSFWYDLRNDPGQTVYESNFGLFSENYEIKPAGKAMKAYNSLVKGKTTDGVEKISTGSAWQDEYGYVAKYSDELSDVYIVYDSNNNTKSTDIPLTGDIAYVYDNLGNVINTIENLSGNKSITMKSSPVAIECLTYKATIESTDYDNEEGIVTVSGQFSGGDKVTVELLENGNVKASYTAKVKDRRYEGWLSIVDGGDYVIRVGYPEIQALGKQEGFSQTEISVAGYNNKPSIAANTEVSYNAENRVVSIAGEITDYSENQYVTILAIPEYMDVNNVDKNAIGFIKQIPTDEGSFSAEFTLPEYYTTKTSIYLGGTGIGESIEKDAGIQDSKYVYAASLDIKDSDSLSASAIVRNFTESDKKASMIIAQYDNAGRLVNVTIEEKTVPGKTYKALECNISDVTKESGAKSAKAFIWSDMTGVVPLAGFDETELN